MISFIFNRILIYCFILFTFSFCALSIKNHKKSMYFSKIVNIDNCTGATQNSLLLENNNPIIIYNYGNKLKLFQCDNSICKIKNAFIIDNNEVISSISLASESSNIWIVYHTNRLNFLKCNIFSCISKDNFKLDFKFGHC